MSALTYTLISGGYVVLRDGEPMLRQTHYPDGSPLVPIADADREPMAQAVIAAIVSQETASTVDYLAVAKAEKQKEINARCDAILGEITGAYPASEVLSWSKQEAEAWAALYDSNPDVPFITALATARGITVADLAARIIAKADAFGAYSAYVIGTRQALEDAVIAATTVEEVEAIAWPQ